MEMTEPRLITDRRPRCWRCKRVLGDCPDPSLESEVPTVQSDQLRIDPLTISHIVLGAYEMCSHEAGRCSSQTNSPRIG